MAPTHTFNATQSSLDNNQTIFSKDLEREKEKLNRFMQIKEQSVILNQQKNEKMRKALVDKEKRLKKKAEAEKKELRQRMKKQHEFNENRRMKLRHKEMEVMEKQREAK